MSHTPISRTPIRRSKDGKSDLGFIVLIVLSLQLIVFWPEISHWVAHLGDPTERVWLGTVRKVTFVGGLGHATQIDTENQSVLLRGSVSLLLGTALERRNRWGDEEVCDLKSGACWELLSR
jgi:hypothetical protein